MNTIIVRRLFYFLYYLQWLFGTRKALLQACVMRCFIDKIKIEIIMFMMRLNILDDDDENSA